MNLIDAYVTELKSRPYKMYDMWFVDVEVTSYGVTSETSAMFSEKKAAEDLKIGSVIQI